MSESIRKINIIGHLHPDTDSICSAIAYAYLKNQIGDCVYEARRAGIISRETAFVLKHFGFEEPPLITTVTPQIKDTRVQQQPGIDGEMSLFEAWNLMREIKLDTLCITNADNELTGLIAVKDIANANMDIFDTSILAQAKTSYHNVMRTLDATMIYGDPEERIESGRIYVGTTPEMMNKTIQEGDTVLVTNRVDTQRCAVESGAKCMIICCGANIDDEVARLAIEKNCTVLATPYDTFAAARLICMSIPVRAKMLVDGILKFSVNTSVEEARKVMTNSRHRFFPVLDENGKYFGLVSGPSLIDVLKKHVILVDHSERAQAVNGLEQAEIVEIIDHHRIGDIETDGPIWYRAMPVGCTSTIVYGIYREAGIEIPKNIAGLMMSAILSDTLAFRSPTCTPLDIEAGTALAEICGEDIETYADQMFDAGSDLTGRTAEEVFHGDFKIFSRGSVRFGVGQGSYMTTKSRKAAEELIEPHLAEAATEDNLPLIFYMFTDVKTQTTELMFYGERAREIVKAAFSVEPGETMAILPGVVSRKKQLIPPLMHTLQEMEQEEK